MWKNITINANNIESETERSVLIKMPNGSNYSGYKFWHPAKLVRDNGKMMSFGYTDSFEFRIFKNGNGKHNRYEKIAEQVINANDIEVAFGVIDEANKLSLEKQEEKLNKSFVNVAEPTEINKEVVVPDELKR